MRLKRKRRKRKVEDTDMSNDFYRGYYEDHYIAHHGILGQKWGIRRYQNPDGTLTDAGKKRYKSESVNNINNAKGLEKRLNDLDISRSRNKRDSEDYQKAASRNSARAAVLGAKLPSKNNTINKARTQKIDKLKKLSEEQTAKYKESKRNSEEATRQIKSLLEKASAAKYEIYSEPTKRVTSKGYEKLIGLGIILSAPTISAIASGGALPAMGAGAGAGAALGGKKMLNLRKGNKYKIER